MKLKKLCELLSDLYNKGYTQNEVIMSMEGDGRRIDSEIGNIQLSDDNKIVLSDY